MSLVYNNDEELEKVWMKDFQKFMDDARNNKTTDEEFLKQQEIYSKYAESYDDAIRIENYSGPVKIAGKIDALYPDNKDIKILDYGCGTGLVADNLAQHGFKNIDGLDPNKALLDVARGKQKMQHLFQQSSDEGHSSFASDTYDVICSAGTFFLSNSHPGFECVKELCRLTKKGGHLIIFTKNAYLSADFVDHTIVESLEKEGILKSLPKELVEGYRKAFEYEEDPKSMAAFLVYELL